MYIPPLLIFTIWYKNIHINTEKEPEKVDTTAEVDQKEETTIEDAVVD